MKKIWDTLKRESFVNTPEELAEMAARSKGIGGVVLNRVTLPDGSEFMGKTRGNFQAIHYTDGTQKVLFTGDDGNAFYVEDSGIPVADIRVLKFRMPPRPSDN
jgi:hypothetical protein